MNRYKLLHELLPYIEDFEQHNTDVTPEKFASWLHAKHQQDKTIKKLSASDQPTEFSREQSAEIYISTLIAAMYKYAKHYTKKALEGTALATLEDFTFLAALIQNGAMSKTELTNMNLIEITSGIEVIKRLLRNELIEETPDENDKRSKLLKVTPQGYALMMQAFGKMNQVSHIVSGALNEHEKSILLSILLKLKIFHETIHAEDRRTGIEEIVEKYMT